MASAWEQLGEIQRINQMRRQAQLGRAVNAVYHTKHFTRFSEESLLKVASTAQSRLVVTETVDNVSTTMMLSRRISQSALPDRAVSAPLRRLTSPSNVISRRFLTAGAPPMSMVAMLNGTTIVQFQRAEAGLVTIDQVSDQAEIFSQVRETLHFQQFANVIDTGPQLGRFQVVAEGDTASSPIAAVLPIITGESPVGLPDSPDALAFRNAAKDTLGYLGQFFATAIPNQAPPLSQTRAALLSSLNPEKTITARVQASLTIASAPAGGRPA